MSDQPHVVFFNTDAAGHLYPTLAFVEVLVKKGAKVTYIVTGEVGDSTDGNREKITALGCTYVHYSTLNPYKPPRTGNVSLTILHRLFQGGDHMLDVVGALSPPPTGIVYDPFSVLGYFIAKKMNLPFACTINASKDLIKAINEKYDFDLMANHLNTTAVFFTYEDALFNILFTVESLLGYVLDPEVNKKIHYAGASIGTSRIDKSGFPLEKFAEAKKAGKKIILISLGTLVQGFVSNVNPKAATFVSNFWRIICEIAKERPDFEIIMSVVGRTRADVEAVAPVPDNLYIASYVPQVPVLRLCDAFLTHGGAGSTNEGLSLGVPLLVLPFFGDQHCNGEAVQRSRVGVNFPVAVDKRADPTKLDPERESFSKEKLMEGLNTIFNDTEMPERLNKMALEYKDRFERMGEEFAKAFIK